MAITYDETVQTVLDLLQRALKAEARVRELEVELAKAQKKD